MAKKYNCEKNGIKYYRKTKTIGYKFDGTPLKKDFYGDGLEDCNKKIEEYMQKVSSGINTDISRLTIEQAMYTWLFDVLLYSKNKKSATFDKHECNYRNYIKNTQIGMSILQQATPQSFQKYYLDLFENGIDISDKNGIKKHKNVSEDKLLDLNKTFRAFFNYCIKQKYIQDNPCSLSIIEMPGNADGEEDETCDEGDNIQAFYDDEINIITDNLKYGENQNNTFNVAIMLDLLTGMRLGELLGLKKKFISRYMVKVRNTLKKVKVFDSSKEWHRETKLIKPKSATSVRDIPFPVPFYETLQKYFKEQELKWKRNGLKFDDESLLFTTETCSPIDMKNFSRAWYRFLNRFEIENKKPHSIRDTYATTLIRRGASIHDVKALLGHSSIKITEKYYIFVFPDDKSKTVALLNDLVI